MNGTNNDFICIFSLYVDWFDTEYTFKDDQKNKLANNNLNKSMCINICSNPKCYVM